MGRCVGSDVPPLLQTYISVRVSSAATLGRPLVCCLLPVHTGVTVAGFPSLIHQRGIRCCHDHFGLSPSSVSALTSTAFADVAPPSTICLSNVSSVTPKIDYFTPRPTLEATPHFSSEEASGETPSAGGVDTPEGCHLPDHAGIDRRPCVWVVRPRV